jgi:hypothetical protein
MSSEKQKHNIERMASAIEDLLFMKVIKFLDEPQHSEKAILSTPFSIIVSNLIADKNFKENDDNEIMKFMYHSLLIYMSEYLAFGNDLEKHREEMQCGELISTYVTVLQNIFLEQRKEIKRK